MEKRKPIEIVGIIIGEKHFYNLLHDITEEYKDSELLLGDMEPLLEAYSSVMLIIAFSNKQVTFNTYKITLSNKVELIIETNDFCNRYYSYIQKITEFKQDLIEKIS